MKMKGKEGGTAMGRKGSTHDTGGYSHSGGGSGPDGYTKAAKATPTMSRAKCWGKK